MSAEKASKIAVDDIVEAALAGAMRALDARGVKTDELVKAGVYGGVHIICGIPPVTGIPPSLVQRAEQAGT
jgi:hypothetical protein